MTGIWQDRIRTTNGDALHFSAWTQRMTTHIIPFGDSWGPRSISIPAIASFCCPIKASSCPSGYSNGIVDVIQGQTTWFPFREHPVSHGVQLANTNYPAADIILKEKHDFWEFFRQSTSYIYNWNQLQTSHALPGYECKRGRCCGCTRQWFCLGKSSLVSWAPERNLKGKQHQTNRLKLVKGPTMTALEVNIQRYSKMRIGIVCGDALIHCPAGSRIKLHEVPEERKNRSRS